MINRLLNLAAWGVIGTLLLFTARRWLFIIFALRPNRSQSGKTGWPWPAVLLLVPLRNEAESMPGLLSALAALAYPPEHLTVVLIDDGSTDDSRAVAQPWIKGHEQWHLLPLEQNVGKAQALNEALRRFPQGEIIAVYDADERPDPSALNHLLAPFADLQVGGVSGRRAVSNALASPAASYTTFEGLVHQLVTMRAKDRLDLAPAILGANCAYRRTALTDVGGFKPGALLEDSDLTVKLAQAGWRVRFVPEAISYHHVPQSLTGYWRQHVRWARGFNEVARDQAGAILADRRLAWPLRLELVLFSLGYLDRVALLGGALLTLLNHRLRPLLLGVIGFNLITPLLQIAAALRVGREPAAMWLRLVWVPLFFGLDLAMAATGLWTALRNLPQVWEERQVRG